MLSTLYILIYKYHNHAVSITYIDKIVSMLLNLLDSGSENKALEVYLANIVSEITT